MKRLVTGLIGLLLISLGIRSTPIGPTKNGASVPGDNDKFTIYVVGKGLKGPGKSDPACDKAGQQMSACAMARGAYAAYESDRFRSFKGLVDYLEKDDQGSPAKAESVAQALGSDPHVLAVIGHSYSETTAEAAKIYADEKIPLLIPVATSPEVGRVSSESFWTGEVTSEHLQNVIRLIPNDHIGQAPSISYIVARLATTNNTIVVDLSDNKQYAAGLETELHAQLPSARVIEISEKCKDQNALPEECFLPANNDLSSDLVVFVGTSWTAKRFLECAIVQHNPVFGRLKYILMTDGGKNVERQTLQRLFGTGIPLLLTFPTRQVFPHEPGFATLRPALSETGAQSYEEYGYDSMLLISEVLEELLKQNKSISRDTFEGQMNRKGALRGANSLFIFHDGENVHPDYGIYASGTDQQLEVLSRTICTDAHRAPSFDQPDKTLRYLCFVGFDEVNLR